jgi:hypothetical protein
MSLKCRQNRTLEAFSRLATVRRLVASAAVLSLAAVSLAACGGGSDAKLLPGTTAAEITENLGFVRQYAEEGECVGAADAAAEVSTQVEALQGVDAKLKEALQRGVAKLDEVLAECEESSAEETTTTEETTKPERRQPPGQEKKEEREREEQAEERETTPPSEKTTPEEPATPPPSEGGGTGAPGGVSPSAPAGQTGSG